MEISNIAPLMFEKLIYDKGLHKLKQDKSFQKMGWEYWINTFFKMKICPFLTPYTNINSN